VGAEKLIAFASWTLRTLNKAESKYAQVERQAIDIDFGVRKIPQYLYGRKFALLTDHCPLTRILRFRHLLQVECKGGLCCGQHTPTPPNTEHQNCTAAQMDFPGYHL
jgi:hypothetical protein